MSGEVTSWSGLAQRRRLQLAAPDLLAALDRAEAFIAGFEDDDTQEGVTEMLAAIRAALAKAKGEVK
tara:strand:- start:560 stop:760 length:201 start_codon:yes stop_codon:yes gene_type:complete